MTEPAAMDLSRARRYACALTGSWSAGDMLLQYVADMPLVQCDDTVSVGPAVSWFRQASDLWNSPVGEMIEKAAHRRKRAARGRNG